jgi:[acyl-carrier-protein] S-malonyltransferase
LSDDRVAADVAGQPIRLSDVEARAALLRRGPAARHAAPAEVGSDDWIRRWAVRQLVGEAVIQHEIGAAPGSGTTDALETTIRRLVARITHGIRIPEHEVRSFYERNPDRYRSPERRRVRFAAFPNQRDAERARDGLIEGRTDAFSVMDLGRGEYAGRFEDTVFAARVGEVVGPTHTDHGWMVARLEAIAPESTVTYVDARAAIAAELLDVARARAFDDWLERRRHELARVAQGLTHPADPIHGQPRHRH